MKKTLSFLLLGLMFVAGAGASVSAFTDTTCTGWCGADVDQQEFMSTARYGDNIGNAGAWEIAIEDKNPDPVGQDDTENFYWTPNSWEDFKLAYNPLTGEVTFEVEGKIVDAQINDGSFFEYLSIVAKGNSNGNEVELRNLEFNGNSLDNSNVATSSDKRGVKITLEDDDQMSAWTLTGEVKLIWFSNPSDEYPGFHIFGMEALPIPECEIVVDSPVDGWYTSPIDVEWHYEGYCSVQNQEVWRDDNGNENMIEELSNNYQREYTWLESNPLFEEGMFKVCVYAHQSIEPGQVKSCSEEFGIDMTPPEVTINDVTTPNVGDCEDDEQGTSDSCYVTSNSEIKLSCHDQGDYKSGGDGKWYKYRIYNESTETWGAWTNEMSYPNGGFNLSEDSEHQVEYWCYDNVGLESEHKLKTFIVDSVAPEITKTVTGPQVGDCPPVEQGDECWIKANSTKIEVNAVDPQPHPVNDVSCEWRWKLDNGAWQGWYDYENGIVFGEDTEHTLEIKCSDALGNYVIDTEVFYVDGSAPTTSKDFSGPYFSNCTSEWIDGVTTVNLSAEDNPSSSVCAVQGVITFYRTEEVSDSYCLGQGDWEDTDLEDESWQTYTEPFTMEESCHVIEYYSVDELGNQEQINHHFVFVDKTAPETLKNVGNPNHDCNGIWESITGKCQEGWDWIITQDTSIEISCEDQEPHPSGADQLCYRIELDGDAVFENGGSGYACSGSQVTYMEEEWCCVDVDDGQTVDISFYEDSEHSLEFYCIDEVEKTSEIDSEMFKVQGTSYEIDLEEKWNLISIPFSLISNSIGEVFEQTGDSVEGVWSYENGEWKVYKPGITDEIETIEPGKGYWVKTNQETSLLVGGSLLSPAPGVPPSQNLEKGWNLIGHYGTEDKSAYCALYSLVDTTVPMPRWSSLYEYNTNSAQFVGLEYYDTMYPGQGYWLEIDVEESYSPATACLFD